MASKLTFGTGLSDLKEGINVARMRDERAARMKHILKREGIPSILVAIDQNVRYLTGFSYGEGVPFRHYVLFFAEHDPVVFAHATQLYQDPDLRPWIKHWQHARCWIVGICGPEAMAEEIKLFTLDIRKELQDRGLVGEKMGIVGWDGMTRDALREAGVNVVEGWPLLMESGKLKTQDEVNCLKMAASICNAGFQRFREVCKVGMTTGALAHSVSEALVQAGAEATRPAIMSGPFSFPRAGGVIERRIEYGDMVLVALCGTKFLGYPACLYRSFIVGREPTAKEKGWYQRVKDTLDAAMDATRVGNTTADAAKAFPPASKWGYKDEVEVLTVEIGHGLMLPTPFYSTNSYAPPVVNRQWSLKHPQPFEKGMVVAYESSEGEYRVNGARLEDMVVVTDDGCEMLDHYPREEIIPVGL